MFDLTQTADLSRWGEVTDRTWQAFLIDVRGFVGAGGAQSALTAPRSTRAAESRASTTDARPSLAIKALFLEKLGRHEEAREAIRLLREAEPSLTLDGIERANILVFAPQTAQDMNATLRIVWRNTPLALRGT